MRVGHVNTTDLADAIRLGCRTMQSVFNADDNDVPFFKSRVRPEASLAFCSPFTEAHVPGRHLNALLNAEDAVGIAVDEGAIEKHRRAALLSFSGPLPFPLNRDAIGMAPVNFCPHNLREGLHALCALVKFRQDRQASDLAERCIAAVLDLWSPGRGWDVERLQAGAVTYLPWDGFITGEARMLGPLVKYYRAAASAQALELALLLKERAVAEFFLADGEYDPQRFRTRHTHSVTSVMSSLAQLADLLGDAPLLTRVKTFYDRGLWRLRDETGWSPETALQEDTDAGEGNNTGDILETALILGHWGHTEYYHDAERILRCHLLPSQLRDVAFIQDPPNPEGLDGLRDVAQRHLGAFGFPAPYGHEPAGPGQRDVSFNMDIVGGVVGSLCEAYRQAVSSRPGGCHVNLLFDRETPAVRVQSTYTHQGLHIEARQPGPLFVRIPPWVGRDEVTVEGTEEPCRWINGYCWFARPPVGREIVVSFPLKEETLTLSTRVHPREIRVILRGDEVAAMDDLGADLTYFPPR